MDILWQTALAMANGTTRSSWIFKLKLFEMRSITCNGNVLFAENKVCELLSVEDSCVEKTSTPPVWFFSVIVYLK